MTFRLEIDNYGRQCVWGRHGNRGYCLVLDDVMLDAVYGRASLVDRQAKALMPLAPLDEEMLSWFESQGDHSGDGATAPKRNRQHAQLERQRRVLTIATDEAEAERKLFADDAASTTAALDARATAVTSDESSLAEREKVVGERETKANTREAEMGERGKDLDRHAQLLRRAGLAMPELE